MSTEPTPHELISLFAGETSAEVLAERHGVTVAEVARWKSAYILGLKAGATPHVPRRRRARLLLGTAAVLATAAFAQLTVFQPDQPALASAVNGNFTQLRTWLEAKVGPVSSNDVVIANKASFGATTRQMLDLFSSDYAVGVQASTLYFRSGGTYSWHQGGTHSNAANDSGGGTEVMRLTANPGRLFVGNRWMLGGQEPGLTTVRGTYTPSSGTIVGGGFTVTRGGLGYFDVTFTKPFASSPSVVCTAQYPTNIIATGGAASCLVSHPAQVSSSTFRVFLTAGDNSAQDWPFSFIAVGPVANSSTLGP